MAASLKRKLAVLPLVLYFPGIITLSHIPIPKAVYKAQVSDKNLHFLAFFILAYFIWLAVSPLTKVNWRKRSAWLVLGAVLLYGALDEWTQSMVGRSCDIADFYADAAGIITAMLLLTVISNWSGFLVLVGITIFFLTNLARANVSEMFPALTAVFYFGSNAFFAALWACHIKAFARAVNIGWFAKVVSVPAGLLVIVKMCSVMMEKPFGARDVFLAAAGIAAAAGSCAFVSGLIRRRSTSSEDQEKAYTGGRQ